jgi:hypothetical protein
MDGKSITRRFESDLGLFSAEIAAFRCLSYQKVDVE